MSDLTGTASEQNRADPVSRLEFHAAMRACAGDTTTMAVAVSGGGDSTALLLLAADWANASGRRIVALTVDHRLRPEAAREAADVGALCRRLGVAHTVLTRHGGPLRSAVQATARRDRLNLLVGWCRDHAVPALLLAHHRNDQAETVLLRLDRGSGAEGLAGMARRTRRDGVDLLRPLIDVPKARLLETCRARGAGWVEDPSNHDRRYGRVRLRRLAGPLADRGVSADRLTRIASAMGRVRAHVDGLVAALVDGHGRLHDAGHVTVDLAPFTRWPAPLRAAALTRMIAAVAPGYPPRSEAVHGLLERIAACATGGWTLGHCRIVVGRDQRLLIAREARFCAPPAMLPPGGRMRWDSRFEIVSADRRPLLVGALGDAGWRRVARLTGGLADAAAERDIPPAARPALPQVRDLDGGCVVPHLGRVTGSSVKAPEFAIRFAPDASWVAQMRLPGTEGRVGPDRVADPPLDIERRRTA